MITATITRDQAEKLAAIIATAEQQASQLLGVPLMMQIVSHKVYTERPEKYISQMLMIAAEEFGTTSAHIVSAARHKHINHARQMFWLAARHHLGVTFDLLGRMTGRDHATVMHGIEHIQGLIDVYPEFRQLHKNIDNKIKTFLQNQNQ